jgi:hypothetical protein
MTFGFANKKDGPFNDVNMATSLLQNGHPILERIVDCSGDKAQEPERICPNCGHYPLVLSGSKGGGYRLAYFDNSINEEEF